ncbi:MAG TPA: apolipoprotein N-acyltransferase [Chitinophagales bacterium]|nr:apolipoprotein N-acyltransferase [Chitinophagales bacterium]
MLPHISLFNMLLPAAAEKTAHRWLTILPALLGWLAWIPIGITPLLFVMFVPLLYLSEIAAKGSKTLGGGWLFYRVFGCFLLFNLFTTDWIAGATWVGMLFAVVTNALLMCVPFMLFFQTLNRLGGRVGYLSFILYWLAFEHLHQRWELAWTWLNLGNALSAYPSFIQWYAYTGSGGGTLWVLLVNMLVFRAFMQYWGMGKWAQTLGKNQTSGRVFLPSALVFMVPILLSLGMFYTYTETGKPVEVVIVQPSENPYHIPTEQEANEQVQKMLALAQKQLTPNTQYLLLPETALPDAFWIDGFTQHPRTKQLRQWLQQYPQLKIISGITALQHYPQPGATPTARSYLSKSGSYDVYNSSAQIDTGIGVQFYHKSKLVPGVERIPYQSVFGLLSPLAEALGGGIGSFGSQPECGVFTANGGFAIAPVICYESVFGQYVTRYVKKGAQLLFIMTNDGWWGNTAGYQQHLHYASMRAIETRRSIARAANTGISAFIDQRGRRTKTLAWQQTDALRHTLLANDRLTFYAQYGDYLGRTAVLLSGLLLLLTFVGKFTTHHTQKIT